MPSDDVVHVGTFDTFLEADLNDLLADNGTVESIWGAIYDGIARVNRLIEQVPNLGSVTQAEKNDILGQAHFLRALHYHNLVKLWGGVPLRLTTPASPAEAAQIARATVDEVYTQIFADLAQARTMLPTAKSPVTASRGAVYALRTRVMLYRGDWAGVVANADSAATLAPTPLYALVADFSSLFTPSTTVEDILRVVFTPEEEHFMGWWYRSKGAFGGRYEIAPSCVLAKAFDANVNCALAAPYATFNPTDQRAQATIGKNGNAEIFGNKWPTGIGDEGIHVIRFAEVILNKAEALARQNNLLGAVTEYNKTRVRAGLTPVARPSRTSRPRSTPSGRSGASSSHSKAPVARSRSHRASRHRARAPEPAASGFVPDSAAGAGRRSEPHAESRLLSVVAITQDRNPRSAPPSGDSSCSLRIIRVFSRDSAVTARLAAHWAPIAEPATTGRAPRDPSVT